MTSRQSTPHLRRRLAVVLVVGLLSGALVGCSTGPTITPQPLPSASSIDTDPAGSPALAAYYGQKVAWSACDSGFECATVAVPVDWAKPSGVQLRLAIKRLPALGKRIGSLFINPGGPGVSGVTFVSRARSAFDTSVRRSFDIIGWDPRGVGASQAIDCISDTRLVQLLAADSTPDDAAEVTAMRAELVDFAQACVQRNGDLLRHVDTVSTAKDLDVLRAVVGDSRLSYYGASYGTYIGSWYAELFPWRVGRLVLDGAVDPSLSIEQYAHDQAAGFAGGVRSYIDACQHPGMLGSSCPLSGGIDAGVKQLQALIAAADSRPLRTADPARPLTQALMLTGIAMGMYSESLWPQLTVGLSQALEGDGSGLLALADIYNERRPDGTYAPVFESNAATYCLDHGTRASLTEIGAFAARLGVQYPPFGDSIGWGIVGCSVWPIDALVPARALHANGAAPILVVGTTRDPATPYAWAQALASQLTSGVLLTRQGSGHGAYRAGNACSDLAIDNYLVAGTVPAKNTVCT